MLLITKDQLIKVVAKSAAAGVIGDGMVSVIEKRGPAGVVRDMACGAITGAAGAVASELFKEYVKRTGPYALIVGVTTSVATRYAYRSLFGPKQEETKEEK